VPSKCYAYMIHAKNWIAVSVSKQNCLWERHFQRPGQCASMTTEDYVGRYQRQRTSLYSHSPIILSSRGRVGIYFWGGGTHVADSITPSDRTTVKLMTDRRQLQFNSSEPQSLCLARGKGWVWHKEKFLLDRTHDPKHGRPGPYP
jgi:hypothetical protein